MKEEINEISPNLGRAIVGVLFLLLLYFIYRHYDIQHQFQSDDVEKSIITGVIIDFNPGAKNAPNFEYEFIVDGEKYEGRHLIVTILGQKSTKELRKYIGKKYKVWYVVEDPTYNKLLLDKPVNDSLPFKKKVD